jgi:enoyl-CoA hydratase/3-hydroxyacyl-CoA dehydrogenase
MMTIPEIKTVCYVGAGTMGCANSLVAAVSGYDVIVYDVSEENLARVPDMQKEMAEFLVATGYCSEADVAAGLARVSCTNDLATATANADLVSESVFEDLGLKRKIHKQLDEVCPAKTILTTNTSALLVSDIEDVVERGDCFAALHSHLGSPLVDIVGGPRTSHATIDVLTRYVLSTKGVPLVLKKENKGYVLNAMLGAMLTTALMLVIEGAASKEDVDRAWMRHRHAPMGPFGLMDQFGLNLIYDSWRHRQPDPVGDVLAPKILAFVGPYIEKGDLGARTGRGFYGYPEPAYAKPAFLANDADDSIPHYAMTAALVGNAILLASNDILPPAEIDRAWMVGMSLDIGPFGILDDMGVDSCIALLGSEASSLSPDQAGQVKRYLRRQEEPLHVNG